MPIFRTSRGSILGGASLLAAIAVAIIAPAAGAASSCGGVSVKVLDSALRIEAAQVSASHPSTAGALICSYFGNSGRSANEATINYLPATAKVFAAIEASLSKTNTIRTIPGMKSGAYSYLKGSERYLYVLDGVDQVQIYATVPLAKLEKLAGERPLLS